MVEVLLTLITACLVCVVCVLCKMSSTLERIWALQLVPKSPIYTNFVQNEEHVEVAEKQEEQKEDFPDAVELTPDELSRLERNSEFNIRIQRMKEELAEKQDVDYHGTTAVEMHPLVKNLPHDAVGMSMMEVDVEYAD